MSEEPLYSPFHARVLQEVVKSQFAMRGSRFQTSIARESARPAVDSISPVV